MSERVERDGYHTQPVDRMAARVARPAPQWHALEPLTGGIHDDFGRNPPGIQPVPRVIEDMTGQKHGRIRLVGFLGGAGPSQCWLGKCDCGVYVRRNGKKWRLATREMRGTFDMCQECIRGKALKNDGRRATLAMRTGPDIAPERRPQRLALAAISEGADTTERIAAATGLHVGLARKVLQRLAKKGLADVTPGERWIVTAVGRRALAHPAWPSVSGWELREIRAAPSESSPSGPSPDPLAGPERTE